MSLLQPRIPLRKWLRTRSLQAQVSRLALPQNATQRQAFHASPSFSAIRSPSANIARNRGRAPGALGDGNLITHHFPIGNFASVFYTTTLEETLAQFNKTGASYWVSACKEGILDHHRVSLYSFMDVGRALLTIAWENDASAMAIRRISTDAEMVFRISFVVSRFFRYLYGWAMAACAQAGSNTAIICAAQKYLSANRTVSDLKKSQILNELKRIAINDKHPSAIILHAWVRSQHEQYMEAVELLRPLIETMYPIRDSRFADLILDGIPKPWAVYTNALYKMEREEEANEIQRIAATQFNDPDAAIVHAYNLLKLRRDSNRSNSATLESTVDFSEYLQLMGIAATAGNGDACHRLGNYYYLRYLHLDPYSLDYLDKDDPDVVEPETNKVAHAEIRVAKEKKAGTWAPYGKPKSLLQYIRYYFYVDRSRDDYYRLAVEWYKLGAKYGHSKAAFLVARLLKQDKLDEQAYDMLNIAEKDETYQSRVKKLRTAWLNGVNPSIRDDFVDL
ncbi:hypothetical protein PHISCL_07100 [Aspergillus sclerotialis]|uniref:Uncharacterized protein n=1 Tax=Aspergillus sclerotialis TaxID=2070753 RepID=A0A3A2ZC98_9EURO|nr:hypothetical protein PHISCL_07100 [Aspergillus sclerotialis]